MGFSKLSSVTKLKQRIWKDNCIEVKKWNGEILIGAAWTCSWWWLLAKGHVCNFNIYSCSKSAFNTRGHIVDSFYSFLGPKMLEASISSQN